MDKISVVIITYNEEENILRCIESVKNIADEMVVVDSGSTDRTIAICEEQGCRVFFRAFDFYAKQKQHAAGLAKNDWILSLDADEALSPELKAEISGILHQGKISEAAGQQGTNGYAIPRCLVYLGHRMKRSGTDSPVRLFDRRKGSFVMIPVHEYVVIEGPPGQAEGKYPALFLP